MLRLRANALMSVRRVTEINAGRETAGVDGKTALLAPQKAALADWVQHRPAPWAPRPVESGCSCKGQRAPSPTGCPTATA